AKLCSSAGRPVTTIMVTNNLDEALLLSDKIVALTRGPGAHLTTPIEVNLPKPRTEAQLLHDPTAVHIRGEVVVQLSASALGAGGAPAWQGGKFVETGTFPSSTRRGGRAAGADGVVRSAAIFLPEEPS